VGKIRKTYQMKRARTSGMAEKAMEERRRSFTIEGEGRISLFNFR
jgi:hypothetical protein